MSAHSAFAGPVSAGDSSSDTLFSSEDGLPVDKHEMETFGEDAESEELLTMNQLPSSYSSGSGFCHAVASLKHMIVALVALLVLLVSINKSRNMLTWT